jgi:hypothetical protein
MSTVMRQYLPSWRLFLKTGIQTVKIYFYSLYLRYSIQYLENAYSKPESGLWLFLVRNNPKEILVLRLVNRWIDEWAIRMIDFCFCFTAQPGF